MSDAPLPDGSGSADPTEHYNTVVDAWAYLLGEDLHYGYFESGDETLDAATDALTNQMLNLARLDAGLCVLDIGCGTGKAACRIATEFGCKVLGISPSTRCIDGASALASAVGVTEHAKFEIGDGTRLVAPDESYDRVLVMESSHLMADKKALIRECARVLRPGGRLVLCDIMLDHKLSLEQVIEYRDEFLLLRDVFGRAKMEPLDFYCTQLVDNQLEIVERRDISRQTFATFARWLENARENQATVEQLIGVSGCAQFSQSCAVLRSFWDKGILGYGLVAAVKAG